MNGRDKMGYRSEVAIGVRMNPDLVSGHEKIKTSPEMFWKLFVSECRTKHPTVFKNASGWLDMKVIDDKYTLRMHEYEVKWYPDYDEVKAFESIIPIAEEYNNQYESDIFDCAFVRIGEESDDVDCRYVGNGWELYDAHTSIAGDLTDEEKNDEQS